MSRPATAEPALNLTEQRAFRIVQDYAAEHGADLTADPDVVHRFAAAVVDESVTRYPFWLREAAQTLVKHLPPRLHQP